jgi:hypothetical protein
MPGAMGFRVDHEKRKLNRGKREISNTSEIINQDKDGSPFGVYSTCSILSSTKSPFFSVEIRKRTSVSPLKRPNSI